MRILLLVMLLEASWAGLCHANIILVPSVHPNIQAGINAANPGDTVQVAPATYTGPSNRNLDFGGKNIVLRSSAGAVTTIIDCQNLARGMRFHTGETAAAIVQGFTIRNGLASGTFGGGILVEGGARPTIRNCRFQANHANSGGGVFVSSAVIVTDCDFEDNSADNYGGAAYGETGSLEATRCSFTQNTAGIGAGLAVILSGTAIVTDCSFTENDPANLGGGFYASASTVALRRCSFTRNTGKSGAGAYLLDGAASIDSCTFTLNVADYGGGGLQTEGVEPLSVTNSIFTQNSTQTIHNLFLLGGGGFRLRDSSPPTGAQVINCLFEGNQALGGLGADGGGLYASSDTALIEGCTFIENHAEFSTGGAYCRRLHNCTFEGNTASEAGGARGPYEVIDCRFTNNHSLSNAGGCYSGSGPDGGPGFISGSEFTGNSASVRGGGLYWVGQQSALTVEDCRFSDNFGGTGGGAFMYLGVASTVTGCTFVGNTAISGGAAHFSGPTVAPPVTVSETTVVGNGAQLGGGFNLVIPVAIENTVFTFGTEGEAVRCSGNGLGVMSCTDVFGNAGGDWTACIADQVGINGNFSLDPLFCNRAGRDFTLAQASPCSPAHSPAGCGLIGAHPVACATPIGIADAGSPGVAGALRVTPNPMRGVGTVDWSGVKGREVELRLYDVTGRLMARRQGLGTSGTVAWSDFVGSGEIPSGVYFLEIGAERVVDARVRLVIIR